MTTRSPRPRSVRATTVWPCRVTLRWSKEASAASHRVRDRLLVAADRLDVDELAGQGHDVGGQVEARSRAVSLP